MDGRKEYFLLGVFVLNLLLNAFVGCPLSFCTAREIEQLFCIYLLHLAFHRLPSFPSAVIFFFPTWRAFVYLISSCSETVLYLKKDFFFAFYCSSLFFSSQTKASRKPYTGMPWLKVYLMLLCAKIISFWLLEITRSFWKEEKNWSGLQEH